MLAVLAVVAKVEDRVVGQQAHGPLGVGVVGDVHQSAERPSRA